MWRLDTSIAIWFALLTLPLTAQKIEHPLDPLSWQEYWAVLEVLQETGHLDKETRFSQVTLQEPSKDLVWKWSPGDSFPRSAFAVVRQKNQAFEAVVDLVHHGLVSWTELKGVQPSFLAEEFTAMTEEVKKHPDFIAAMDRRAITDLTFIDCSGVPPGYFGTDEQRGRRIAYVRCRDARGVRNTWNREIEGLIVVVDMNERKVIRVADDGSVPVTRVSADYDQASIGETRQVPGPIDIEQPLGPGFELEGHQVKWQKWSFHVRPDQRVGMILSTVAYQDGQEERPVLYQGHLSEIFVPYMDPSFAWYARNFLDVGEFIRGGITKPLMPGLDCPNNATYFDFIVARDNGRPRTVPRTICLFERDAGDMSWRHWADAPESRPKRDLVVRAAAVFGSYDYVFDWVFQQDGTIRVAVGATGIAEVKAVSQASALTTDVEAGSGGDGDGPSGAEPSDAYGRFVDRNTVATNHDHYFSFRLDVDVDGTANSVVVDRLVTRTLPEGHPRRSLWVRESMPVRTEGQAKLNIDLKRPALWRVANLERTNHVGYPTSYQLSPGKNARTLLTEDDYPRRRAGFVDYHLWVTPYRPEERFAAGDYPTLSEPGQGLPEWTAADRNIENTDIVLWHTVGMHHMVRSEDWPVMPVLWHTFELRPFDFFDRNPALDLPRSR